MWLAGEPVERVVLVAKGKLAFVTGGNVGASEFPREYFCGHGAICLNEERSTVSSFNVPRSNRLGLAVVLGFQAVLLSLAYLSVC